MKIGYARVSTEEQSLDLQIEALKRAGCNRIFTDYGISGKGFDRPGLHAALSTLKAGDLLVVWRLDRLGRSLSKLVQLVEGLGRREVEFQSLTESINTTSPGGRLTFHIMAALAEFERALISERTRAGMAVARKKGRHLGRPPSMSPEQVSAARRSLKNGERSEIVAKRFNVTLRTLKRHVARSSKAL